MPIVGLLLLVLCLVAFAFALPLAGLALAAAWGYVLHSGFLLVPAIALVVIPLLAWLDPRERARRRR